MFNEMRIDSLIHMKEDHHMTITVNDLETMIAIMTVTMMISIIHLVLVFDDLLLRMQDLYLYRITGTWLVRETLLFDLLSTSSRKKLEVLDQKQLLLLQLIHLLTLSSVSIRSMLSYV